MSNDNYTISTNVTTTKETKSEIDNMLDKLNEAVKLESEKIARLRDQIKPVLQSNNVYDESQLPVANTYTTSCPLSQELDMILGQLISNNKLLDNLIDDQRLTLNKIK